MIVEILHLRGTDEGGKLKSTGTSYWKSQNIGASDEVGFSALPGGIRDYSGAYSNLNRLACFWTSTDANGLSMWSRTLKYDKSQILRYSLPKASGLSVRCVKD